MIFGVFGSPGDVNCHVGSVLRWPVSVIAVAYPLAGNSAMSTELAEELRLPANPPTPLKINFPFQLAGNMASKPAEFGPAPSPEVATEPFTSQYCGFGAAAGTSVADVIGIALLRCGCVFAAFAIEIGVGLLYLIWILL